MAEKTREAVPGGQETILLVEDELSILDMIATFLAGQGYSVLRAGTTTEAIRLAGQHGGEIGLLITDVIMPGMNGKELADYLQPLQPQLRSLFMSGYTADVIAAHGVLDQGVNFIQKPFTFSDLAAKIRQVLDNA
jgi:DNA-binding response OmpR family regulator